MPARVISGAVLLVGVIGALWFLAPIYLLGVALIVALLAFREYLDIAARAGVLVSKPAGAMAVALACVAVAIPGMPVEVALAGTTLGLSTLALWQWLTNERPGSEAGGALAAAAIAAFAPLYIGVPLGLLAATRWTLGREAALLLILTVAVSDTFQYYSGRMFGRRLLAPVVSPKKTVEGAIGGLVGAVLALSVIGIWWLPQMSLPARMAPGIGDCRGRHRRRSLRVAAQTQREHEGCVVDHSRPWRCPRSDRCPAVCGSRVLRVCEVQLLA